MAQFAGTVDKVTAKGVEMQIVLKARLDGGVLQEVAGYAVGQRVTVVILSQQLEIVASDEDGVMLRGDLTISGAEREAG